MTDPKQDKQLYMRLLRYVLPHWRVFLFAILAMIILALTDPLIPALLQPMLDGAFIEQDQKTVVLIPILFVALFAVRGVAAYVSGGALHWVANTVIMRLRQQMFDRLLYFPNRFFDQHTSGSIISKFTYDVMQIREASTNALTVLIRDSLAILGLLAYMFYVDWKLSLIALISGPFIAVIVIVIRRRLRKMSRKFQESMADINHVINECFHAIKVIKIYDGYAQEQERFRQIVNSNRRYAMKFAMAAVASSPAVQLITACFIAIIVYVATQQAIKGGLSVGAFVSFFGAMAMLLGPLKRLVGINEFIQRGLAACESVFAILDEPIETSFTDETKAAPAERLQGKISAKSLSFSYETQADALCELNFNIQPGETVALVGLSGSGKSTLVSLLAGFYPVSNGQVLIDGKDIRDISLKTLRANIALVSQDVVLFNDTIRNNIAYGELRHRSEAEVVRAAEAAYAMEFIDQLPQGMDTIIGADGTQLSGGQRQRLAIARALLKDAPILIFDEATSALDSVSERQIQEAMDRAKQGRTCIIIAHRLSTVENADRVFVMKDGRMVESGTHRELLDRQGQYAELYRLQFGAAQN